MEKMREFREDELPKNKDSCRKMYLFVNDWPKAMVEDSGMPRIVWCPYVPEDPNDSEDLCHMIAVFKASYGNYNFSQVFFLEFRETKCTS